MEIYCGESPLVGGFLGTTYKKRKEKPEKEYRAE